MSYALQALIDQVQATVPPDIAVPPDLYIQRLNTLADAQPHELSFLSNPRYQSQLVQTQASAVLLRAADWASYITQHTALPSFLPLIVADPYVAFARLTQQFEAAAQSVTLVDSIHPNAHIHPSARLGQQVQIAAGAVVGAEVSIGDRTVIGANAVIGDRVQLGEACWIGAQVVIEHDCQLGDRVRVHAQAVIGAEGFGFAPDFAAQPPQWVRIAQLGRVVIGDDCRIGACTMIDRGTLADTVLERGVLLDNHIQVAHNVKIGELTVIAACTGISGSTQIGRRCRIAGGVGIAGHLTICDDVQIEGMSLVSGSIRQPGSYAGGVALAKTPIWRRNAVRARQLDQLLTESQQQIKDLQARLDALELRNDP